MPNLLANPTAWNTTYWTGTEYLVDDSANLGVGTFMTLIAPVNAGDTLAGTFQNFFNVGPHNTPPDIVGLYSGENVLLYSWSLDSVSGPTPFLFTFAGTEGPVHLACHDSFGVVYRVDFAFVPSATPPSKMVITKGPRFSSEVKGYALQPTGTNRVLMLPGG